jgi:hypothetical protein
MVKRTRYGWPKLVRLLGALHGLGACAVDGAEYTSPTASIGAFELTESPPGVALSARLTLDDAVYTVALTRSGSTYDAAVRDASGETVASWHGTYASSGAVFGTIDGTTLGGDDARAIAAATPADATGAQFDNRPTSFDQPAPAIQGDDAALDADLAAQLAASESLLRRENSAPTGRALLAIGTHAAALAADPANAAQHDALAALMPLGDALRVYAPASPLRGGAPSDVSVEAATYHDCTFHASAPWLSGSIVHNSTRYGAVHGEATATCGRAHRAWDLGVYLTSVDYGHFSNGAGPVPLVEPHHEYSIGVEWICNHTGYYTTHAVIYTQAPVTLASTGRTGWISCPPPHHVP